MSRNFLKISKYIFQLLSNKIKNGYLKNFAKLIKAIEVSARSGGADVSGNPTLFDAIAKAKKNSNGLFSQKINVKSSPTYFVNTNWAIAQTSL